MRISQRLKTAGRRVHFVAAAVLLAAATVTGAATKASPAVAADPAPTDTVEPIRHSMTGSIPAGTRLRFHLVQPLASDRTKTGTTFSFVLLAPIAVDGRVLVTSGALGAGTVVLSGHNGTSGHEGDLTLRLDSLSTRDGQRVAFADQRIRMNGRNKKVATAILGFVPFAGIGARLIRGSEIHLDTTTPIETVLLHPANVSDATAAPVAPPS